MSPALKKLSLGLLILTGLSALVLIQQIRDARLINVDPQRLPLISTASIDIPFDKNEPLLGNPGAPLTIVAYLNLDDNRSQEYYRILADVTRKNPTKARLVVKHYPAERFFSNPTLTHQALFCAHQQGRFWAYADGLAAASHSWEQPALTTLAETTRLNIKTWEACLNDPTTMTALQKDVAFVRGFGLPEAPILFLNNKLLNPEEEVDLRQMVTSFISP